jgi:hypothetical protein
MPEAELDLLDRLVLARDRRFRRRHAIREFSDDPRCIFRLLTTKMQRTTRLSDGTVLRVGEPVGALHLASERMPLLRARGGDLAWGKQVAANLVHSLRLLAALAAEDASPLSPRAFGNDFVLPHRSRAFHVIERIGFDVLEPRHPSGPRDRAVHRAVCLWTALLRRAHNPLSVRGLRPRDFQSRPVWITRRTLLARYRSTPA